jgi:hypothetical protein
MTCQRITAVRDADDLAEVDAIHFCQPRGYRGGRASGTTWLTHNNEYAMSMYAQAR